MHGGVTITQQCPDPMSHVLYDSGVTQAHGIIQYVFNKRLVHIIVAKTKCD